MARTQARATVAIAALTAIAWLIVIALGLNEQAALAMGFIPARLNGAEAPWAAVPAILTPLTATLVHSGLLHLAFNLMVFVWCGATVERALGSLSLVILYVLGAYAACLAQWAVSPTSTVVGVGASGAISAVIGAFALMFGRPKRVTENQRINRWIHILWLLAAWVVLQLMLAFLLASTQGILIGIPAHVGGFLAGLLLQRPVLLWRYRSA